MASGLQRYQQQQQRVSDTIMDQLDNSILSGAAGVIGLEHNNSRLSYGDVDREYEYDHGDLELSGSAGNWMMNLTNDTGTTSVSRKSISHPLFGHLLGGNSMDNNDEFERRFNEANPTFSTDHGDDDDDESATSFDSSRSGSQTTGSTTTIGFLEGLDPRNMETFDTTFTPTEDEDSASTSSLEDKRGKSKRDNQLSSFSRLFGGATSYLDRPVTTQTQDGIITITERDSKQQKQSSITGSCRLPLSSVLPTTTTSTSFSTLNYTQTTTPRSKKDTTAASDCSRPFDEAAETRASSLLDLNRPTFKPQHPKPVPPPPPPPKPHTHESTSSQRKKREPLGSKAINSDDNTAAPLDELQDDAKAKQQQQRRPTKTSEPSSSSTNKKHEGGPELSDSDVLLCVYICVDPHCPRGAQCQPPDILREAKNMKKTIKDPAFFYVPVSLILRREEDMREAAKQTEVPRNRWNGSLLFRKWQEQEALEKKRKQRNNKNEEDDSTNTSTTTGFVNIVNCTLHPVQDLAQAHVVSPKFPWWQSWLTVCIRAYYNTGTIRIPKHCHGLEILLALEFFGILYGNPDQLAFDDPAVYQKVKQWSRYFTHRATLAKWVVDTLKEKQLEEQQQQQGNNNNKKKYPGPFVFCTHPKSVKPGWNFTIEPLHKSIIIFEGGLKLEDPSDIGSGKKHRRKKRSASRPTSEQMVHGFFVPSPKDGSLVEDKAVDDPVFSSPEIVPGMMREDFKSYLQHVLPDVELTFAIKEIKLVSNHLVMGRKKKKSHGDATRRAVLVASFNPHPAMAQHKTPGDPKGWPKAAKNGGKLSPIRPTPSSAKSIVSVDTSISNAPTDEIAFSKLLETTHKAVASLLEHTTKEKLIGERGRHEEFYFHNTGKKISTPDTTGSSEGSLMLEEPPVTYRSSKAVHGSNVKTRNDDTGPPDPIFGMPKPSKVKKQPNNVGYGASALDTSHIYGGELLLDSLFPNPTDDHKKLSGTGVSQQSPIWTPSLVTQEDSATGGQTTPLPFVNASPPDQMSVTSSITRQPESVKAFEVNAQDTREPQTSEKPTVAVAEKDGKTANSAPHRQSRATTCGDVEVCAPKQNLDADDQSGAKKLHDESFEARFEQFMSDDGEPYKKVRLKQKKNKRMKRNLQKALDDLKFGVSAKDLAEIREAATGGETANVDSCQFLNDMFDVFAPSMPDAVGCDDGTNSKKPSKRSKGPNSKQSRRSKGSMCTTTMLNSSVDSSSLDSDGSTFTWSRQKQYPATEAMAALPAALLVQLFSAGQKAPAAPRTATVPKEISSPVRGATTTTIKKPLARETRYITDDNENSGIEVYHIPQTVPTPPPTSPKHSTRLLMRRKQLVPPNLLKGGSGRDRSHPPRSPRSKPSSTVPPKGGTRTASIRATPKDAKKSKGLFGFLRKK